MRRASFLFAFIVASVAFAASNEHILYIARHGQTGTNKEDILVAQQLDPRAVLTDLGKEQAKGLAKLLSTAGIQRIYVSRLVRTQETAAPLAQQLGLTPVVRSYLDEQNFGSLEGMSLKLSEVRAALDRGGRELLFRPGGGENVAEVQERISHFLQEVFRPEAPKTVLAIGHYGTVLTMIGLLMKLTPEQNAKIAPKNDQRYRVDWADGEVKRFQRSEEGKPFVDVKVEDLYSSPVARTRALPPVARVAKKGAIEARK